MINVSTYTNVATSLLRVYQRYTKGIRFLLVMFLTLTVSANVWGAEVTFNISNYASANKWTNGTAYSSANINTHLTATKGGTGDNGKYYTSNSSWRFYEANNGSITISTNSGTLQSITFTYSKGNNGVLKYNNNDINSGTACSVSGTSATFTVSHSSGTKNGNVQITSITITYTPAASCNPITPSLSYTPSSLSVGGTANPTLTGNSGNGSVTYSSSNTSVATVNASTGIVTAKAAGATTITATIAANNGYCEGTATANVTVTADPYTVTLVPGSGTCAASVTEASAGAGVTLPTPTLDCGDWEFAGWKTTSAVTTETTTEPTLIPAGAYSPTSDITLYAVYQRTETTEGAGTTEVTKTVSISDYASAKSWNNENRYTTVNIDANITATASSNPATNTGKYYSSDNSWRFYQNESGKLVITAATGSTLKSITLTFSNKDSGTISYNSNSCTTNVAVAVSGQSATFTVGSSSGSKGKILITKISVTYTTTGGGSSTTYYHSTPDCGSTASTYTLTLDSDLSCVTDGSATVELNATELTNFTPATRDGFTCSGYWSAPSGGVKVLNADGTFAATSVQDYITDGKWTNEGNVTLTPRWECSNTMTLSVGTQSGGTYSLSKTSLETCDCTDAKRQVTITATPNSGYSVTDISYSGDGTATKVSGPTVNGNNTEWVYQFNQGDNGTGTFTVTFTTIPIYTVTFNAGSGTCDDESLTETSGGAGVTLPTANPPAACATDGWEFAGWWTEEVGATTTSPGELLTAGSNYKPDSDCTLYAVYSHTEAGGGGGSQTVTLTNDDIGAAYVGSGDNKTTSYGNHTIVSASGTWGGRITIGNESSVKYVGISADNENRHLASPIFSANITNITIRGRHNASKTRNIYICSSNTTAKPTSGDIGSGSIASSGVLNQYTNWTDVSIPVLGDYKNFYVYADGGLQIYSIVVTTSGGSTTTYNSNPVCVASWSITYNFAGGTGSHCSNTSVPQGEEYIICEEEPIKEGHTFQGWSDGTSTYDAGAPITPTKNTTLTAQWQINTYTVTWSNNGVPTPVEYNHGVALVVPEAPESCDGVKEFVGWTTHSGYYHATTAPDDIFTTKTTPVTATATYYAVFATPPGTGGGGGGSETTIDDVLTRETTGVTSGSTNYASWSGKKVTSSAIYAGNSAGDHDAIQLRSNNSNSGIVTTTSGGKVTHVEVDWESNTASDRTLDIYGRNVAYSDASDLYSTSTQGTKLGSIVYGTSTELEITGDYEYIGLRSKSGAMYLTSVTITWSSAGGSSSYTDYTTICQEVTGIAISGSYPTTFVQYDSFSFAGGIVTATFENGPTQDVTSLATFSGYNMDEVGVQTVTVTYMGQTAKYEITINQSDRWRLTWNVSGKTNTGASPIYVQKDSVIGTLPVPEVPAACAGKTFMGWTESNIVPSDGKGIVYITAATVPTKNTTYYAVFATVNNFCTQKPIDQITSGSKVVIVAVASLDAGGTTGKAISSRTAADGNNLASDDVFVLDEQINTPHSTCVWTLTREVSGKYTFTQDGKYLNAVVDPDKTTSGFCKFNSTKDTWTISEISTNTYRMLSSNQNKYVEWFTATGVFKVFNVANTFGTFDMQFFVTANANGGADITDYTTGCEEYTITYYGFRGGYSTSSSSDGTIVLPVNSLHTVPDCGDVVKDHTNLGREFLNVWMTKPHGGHTFEPGDTIILTQDTTLYAQWKLETNSDLTTLPTDIEDLAGTDVYVYGGKTLNIQPGTTTINSLTLKGGLIGDGKSGNYAMPSVWVPEGATLVRNSNKIYLDLVVNAKTWYPFAVPFEIKNTSDIHYLHPDMRDAATYGKHFDIKTYDGARRADVGEDKANNWVRLKRHTTDEPVSFKPGVGYIISAMAYPGKDTATIRIPMTVPNTWFKNGEQVVVGTTVRNTIAVTAHGGPAATEHLRHAGWNFVANPYLSYFTGGGIDSTNGLDYIDGELIINSGFSYGGEAVPYVTIPAYDFSCYTAHKLSDIKLSPEYSFFVQVGTSGTMNFTTEGRQKAPAALRSNIDNPRIETDIVISHNQQTADHTGLIIDDRYTTAYEIGADLEKMFGSAYNTTIYTLGNDVRLAYNALSHIEATIPIPLGFRAETDGEYTISLTNPEDILTVESIVLQDSYNNTTTNLLLNDYTFYTDRTQDDQRFVVYIVPHNNAPTDISTIIDNDTETRKVIHNHRLYIIHNGHVYDGVGQTIQ